MVADPEPRRRGLRRAFERCPEFRRARRVPGTRILVLTTFELDRYVFGALRAGASGFLLKGGEPTDLLKAIRVVAAATRC